MTIYEALKAKLGREPKHNELKADVQRIIREAIYNPPAVDKAIAASRRRIGPREASAIHALLKGRH